VPDLDGWAAVERLLKDLASPGEQFWLVIDDLHELDSAEALRQLEFLVMHAPAELRLVLIARADMRLGLHRLRLEGELTEIRAADLRFTLEEAEAMLDGAGVALAPSTLARLHERTEGWAAGLRLAALSLAGHPDPERFAAEFSGSERTVARYLLAEVLERQSEEVKRLLLRTCVLERVSGQLADLLTGASGGERTLQDLEQAGAFVVSLDTRRSWFRYHRLFAELLQLQLRRTNPEQMPDLHKTAADWFAGHGFGVEAVRHAQAAEDWQLAAHLLTDCFHRLVLDGQGAAARQLLTRFPGDVVAAHAELAALATVDEAVDEAADEAADEASNDMIQAQRPSTPETAQPLTDTETRVLHYLPTNLAVPEIAGELCVSVNTIRTHTRQIFAKLGAHRRSEAVERARAVGLLTPTGASRPLVGR
jgi:LuxR family transcriptional regulator, maltose regulon positive regulatory protein